MAERVELAQVISRERRRSRRRLRRSRTPRSDNQDSSLVLQRQIIPAYQARDLPDLVTLGLPTLDLKVDEFGWHAEVPHSATQRRELPQ